MAYQVEQKVEGEWSTLWVMDATFLPRTFANAEAAQEALFRYRRQKLFTPAPLGNFRILARNQHHIMLDYLRVYQRLHAEMPSRRHLTSPALLDYSKNLLRLHLIRLHQELGEALSYADVIRYFEPDLADAVIDDVDQLEKQTPPQRKRA